MLLPDFLYQKTRCLSLDSHRCTRACLQMVTCDKEHIWFEPLMLQVVSWFHNVLNTPILRRLFDHLASPQFCAQTVIQLFGGMMDPSAQSAIVGIIVIWWYGLIVWVIFHLRTHDLMYYYFIRWDDSILSRIDTSTPSTQAMPYQSPISLESMTVVNRPVKTRGIISA